MLQHVAVGDCAVVGLEDELKGLVPLALCVLKNGETETAAAEAPAPSSHPLPSHHPPRFCRRGAEPRGDLRGDREAGEGHGGTRGHPEEGAVRPGVTQDALGKDPPLVSRQPGQRETLQGMRVRAPPRPPPPREETADPDVSADHPDHRGPRRLRPDRAGGGERPETTRRTKTSLRSAELI